MFALSFNPTASPILHSGQQREGSEVVGGRKKGWRLEARANALVDAGGLLGRTHLNIACSRLNISPVAQTSLHLSFVIDIKADATCLNRRQLSEHSKVQ